MKTVGSFGGSVGGMRNLGKGLSTNLWLRICPLISDCLSEACSCSLLMRRDVDLVHMSTIMVLDEDVEVHYTVVIVFGNKVNIEGWSPTQLGISVPTLFSSGAKLFVFWHLDSLPELTLLIKGEKKLFPFL